jgi:hypothetical protein
LGGAAFTPGFCMRADLGTGYLATADIMIETEDVQKWLVMGCSLIIMDGRDRDKQRPRADGNAMLN